LVEHFLTTRRLGSTPYRIEPDALAVLQNYDWPGNVRELANVLERAQILAENHLLTLDDLPGNLVDAVPTPALATTQPQSLRTVEQQHVLNVLRQEKGNKVHAAKILGISRRALYRLLEKYGLQADKSPLDRGV
jgi:DNA-binding NtrC family response regulator